MTFNKFNLAPIVLFVYNRPKHLKQTVNALKKNFLSKRSELLIFSDGPKKGDENKVEEVRSFIRNITGFKKIKIYLRKNNNFYENCEKNIVKLLNKHGRIIMLEDDVVTARRFLKFMNSALKYYQKDKSVYAVSGHSRHIISSHQKNDIYKLNAISYGLGLYKRSAKLLKHISFNQFKNDIKNKKKKDNLIKLADNILYDLLPRVMFDQLIASDVKMTYYMVRNNFYSIYPSKNLVRYIGADKSGANCGIDLKLLNQKMFNKFSFKLKHSENLVDNSHYMKKYYKLDFKQKVSIALKYPAYFYWLIRLKMFAIVKGKLTNFKYF